MILREPPFYYHPFFEQFPKRARAMFATMYAFAVRGHDWVNVNYKPTQDSGTVLARVEVKIDERLSYEWLRDEDADLRALKAVLWGSESREYAQEVIDAERDRLAGRARRQVEDKERAKQKYVAKAMNAKPASDKQKAFLESLGFAGDVHGLTMSEASEHIQRMKGSY